ncbi:carotene epsilon-monooxygenase, chloroplastic isoform X7 [Nymphaea colorata]|uniref:carotene epsilon-monooxygenase, chloroplastic isoform X5 n=2 Tax=Nymphaea colorata TaxID=210225 RepID=UPI00129E831D|nr:carotene epsilon-monooxygenase, chloroplastic isoform X5 [Nymphaea colorata]XP_049933200.1 carotene epsilon-monooxygenase, chloroplastic isoform X6 [Nymphaea colorata]XP_049933201.1 carotene epsilon-monooxygenase, chloroplastic isoform X7 [Nymphaea colorata]
MKMATLAFPPLSASTSPLPTFDSFSGCKSKRNHFNLCSVIVRRRRASTPTYISVKAQADDGNKKQNNMSANGRSASWVSPDWLTSLSRLVKSVGGPDDSGIPLANAKLEDVSDLLGGALFLPLFKWMNEYGPIYRLAAGPRNFVVVSDPAIAKHVLKNYGRYAKGLVSEVSEFLFGSGFAIAEGEAWTVRRRAVVPSLHRKYLSTIVDQVFCKCAERLVDKLKSEASIGSAVNMEQKFSQLTLDVIGLSLFNYNFDSLTSDSPVINAVYTALKEAESRSTDILPYWKIGILCKIIPRQIKAAKAVATIRKTVDELIAKCKEIVEAEGEKIDGEEYVNESDPSILRFLLASREEVSSLQLRDDLLSMLVAGHETTGSVLTWTLYLLCKNPFCLVKAREEVDKVLQGRLPSYEDTKELKYIARCLNESMRLYPHPPVLLRRAQVPDELPGNYKVNAGQDIMISIYNIHHSAKVWERAEEFIPERFDLDGPIPNETNTDFRFIPFSGGPRKCIGDQFALLQAIVALAVLLQHMDFKLVPNQEIGMTTGATIHTTNGMYMTVAQRSPKTVLAASARKIFISGDRRKRERLSWKKAHGKLHLSLQGTSWVE